MESPTRRIDQLRELGAERREPVRFRYLESLEQRLRDQRLQHSTHWQRLLKSIADFEAHYAEPSNRESSPSPVRTHSALAELVGTLNRQEPEAATPSGSSVEQLVRGETMTTHQTAGHQPKPLRAFSRAHAGRNTQTLEQRIQRAIEQVPAEAGPMNGHRLVSRAIAEMQRLSPDYLNRFVGYADTLMVLEQLARKH